MARLGKIESVIIRRGLDAKGFSEFLDDDFEEYEKDFADETLDENGRINRTTFFEAHMNCQKPKFNITLHL